MGQAKIRGSFEDRKAQSIARKEAEARKRQEEYVKWWDSLSVEEKKEELNKQKRNSEVISSVYDMLKVLGPYIKINKTFRLI